MAAAMHPSVPVRTTITAAAAIAALPAVAVAQDAPPSSPDIVVTGLPTPPANAAYGPVTIDDTALRATAAGTIEAALARVPGFQQFRRADSRSANVSSQGISLRGLGGNAASRTLLLLDGVPQADAFFGFVPFTLFPADSIARAEVVRGSGTGPFGAGAVAGTILLESRDPRARAPLTGMASIGSRASRSIGIGAAVRAGEGTLTIDARHDAGDGFATTPAAQRTAASVPSRYRGSTVALGAQVPVAAQAVLSARVAGFADDRTLRFVGADNAARGIDASLRVVARGRWGVDALGWMQMRDFSSTVVSATTLRVTLDQRQTPTTGWGGKLELRPPVGPRRLLRLGLDVRGADGRADEDVIGGAGTITLRRSAGGRSVIVGGFAEGDAIAGPLALTAGVRADHWRQSAGFLRESRADGSVQAAARYADRSGTIATARAGARLRLGEAAAIRASAYTGFRVPTLNELYRGFTVFPIVTRANPALAPERLRGVEAAVDLTPARGVAVTLTAFDNRLAGAIANVTIGPNLRERRNLAAIRARGIEGTVRLRAGAWQFDAGGSYAVARVTDPTITQRLRPAQVPRVTGSLTAGWHGSNGALVQGGIVHTGRQFEDDRNIDILPPATTIDALVRLPIAGRGWQVEVRGENLANAVTVTRSSGGSQDLGIPRTLWLGLRFGG